MKTSIVLTLTFPSNTISSCFFIIDLYFLIPAAIAQIFIRTAELVIATGTQTDNGNTEIETQALIVESKINNIFYENYAIKSPH